MADITESTKYYSPLQARIDSLPLSGVHWLIWVCATLGFVVDSMDLYLISYAMPLIAVEWSMTSESMGLIASASMFGMMFGAYFWGIASDRLGRRLAMQSTIGIFSIITGLCALCWNTLTLFICRFLVGAGLGGLIPVDYAIQAEFIPPKYRGKMMAGSLTVWPLGGFIGALIAYTLTSVWGWKALFIAGAVPGFLIFAVRFLIPESPRYLIDKGKQQEAASVVAWLERKCNVIPDLNSTSAADTEVVIDSSKKDSSLKLLFCRQYIFRTILTSGIWFCHCLPYYGILLWLPTLFIKYYNIPKDQTLEYMMILTGVGIIGRFVAMLVLDSWGRKPVMISYAICSGLGMIAYTWASDTTQLLIVAIIAAFFYEGIWSSIAPYTAELFPTRIRSTGAGFASGIGRLAAAIAPLVIGLVVDKSLPAVFFTFGGLLFIEAIFVSVFAFETKAKSLEQISA